MKLAIDPGRDTGWAIFTDAGTLHLCGLGDPPVVGVRRVLIERPQVYRASLSKGDPNDLITLAIQVGKYTERFESRSAVVGHVLPNDWKGQVPKDIHHARIFGALSDAEKSAVDMGCRGAAPSKRHNVLDAVGLGKWATKLIRWP